jgi:hypothetical protein
MFSGTLVVFGGCGTHSLEKLNETAWEFLDLKEPLGLYCNTMVQLPCPVN